MLRLQAQVRINAYKVIDDAVERAIRYGYHRAHKHMENPSEDQMISEIHRSIMNDLCEILQFGDELDDES